MAHVNANTSETSKPTKDIGASRLSILISINSRFWHRNKLPSPLPAQLNNCAKVGETGTR